MANPRVYLRPPVQLMRPAPARTLPHEDAMPGGCQYSVKLDGFRGAAFALPEGPVLQSRTGRDLAPRFPQLAAAIAALPAGAVLDGEIVAWRGVRLSRVDLARTAAARAREGVQVRYVAFDVLAVPDARRGCIDVRDLALEERWGRLTALLADVPPPIETILATRDRATALTWLRVLPQIGVEGVVVKPLGGAYGGFRWVKVRGRVAA